MGEERPRYFYSRIARFERISIAALDADGTLRTIHYSEAEAKPFAAGPVFQLELPEVKAETRAVLVRVERPHSIPLLTEARLSYNPEDADWSQVDMMVVSLVVGMLVLPLLFDITFFVVLRERFVLLHAAMVTTMIAYIIFASGLISFFAALSLRVIAVAAPLSFAICIAASALFLAEFPEDQAQSRMIRRLTLAAGAWALLVPGFFALQLHVTQPIDDLAYFLAIALAVTIIVAAITEAVWRGSRSARFIAIAWIPIIIASIERMLRGLGVYMGPSDLDQMLYFAAAIEVIVISLAIADRFLALRRERDAAVTEARMLEQISERDPLTGLMNRRAVEERFAQLRAQGFDTFALIDLDKFKDINDRFGHQTGDCALIAAAEALRGSDDRDTIALRLGGEEFVLLLRGTGALRRAEAVRQAIPIRIAQAVTGLDRPVTASMGVVELPRSATGMMGFNAIYARADALLYEAKSAGRNRMLYERLTLFEAPAPRRPWAA
jgi:diguanylate cyclase (GGDEF)-like protein